jgi:hypothetical protein
VRCGPFRAPTVSCSRSVIAIGPGSVCCRGENLPIQLRTLELVDDCETLWVGIYRGDRHVAQFGHWRGSSARSDCAAIENGRFRAGGAGAEVGSGVGTQGVVRRGGAAGAELGGPTEHGLGAEDRGLRLAGDRPDGVAGVVAVERGAVPSIPVVIAEAERGIGTDRVFVAAMIESGASPP